MKCTYDGSVTLEPGTNYVTSVFYPGDDGDNTWYASNIYYWTSGPGADGVTNGPLSAPSSAAAINGQGVYNNGTGAFNFPGTTDDGFQFWVDVEVTPPAGGAVTGVAATVTAAGGAGSVTAGADVTGVAAAATAQGGTGSANQGTIARLTAATSATSVLTASTTP